MSPFLSTSQAFFYSWSKLLQIATENRNSGENNSVIKYANSGLPKYQGWKKKADLSKIQNSSSALSHAAKSKAYEHTNYTMNINASLFLPQSFQQGSNHFSTQIYSCSQPCRANNIYSTSLCFYNAGTLRVPSKKTRNFYAKTIENPVVIVSEFNLF